MESIYDGCGLIDNLKFARSKQINEIVVTMFDKDKEGNILLLKGIYIPYKFLGK